MINKLLNKKVKLSNNDDLPIIIEKLKELKMLVYLISICFNWIKVRIFF